MKTYRHLPRGGLRIARINQTQTKRRSTHIHNAQIMLHREVMSVRVRVRVRVRVGVYFRVHVVIIMILYQMELKVSLQRHLLQQPLQSTHLLHMNIPRGPGLVVEHASHPQLHPFQRIPLASKIFGIVNPRGPCLVQARPPTADCFHYRLPMCDPQMDRQTKAIKR